MLKQEVYEVLVGDLRTNHLKERGNDTIQEKIE